MGAGACFQLGFPVLELVQLEHTAQHLHARRAARSATDTQFLLL